MLSAILDTPPEKQQAEAPPSQAPAPPPSPIGRGPIYRYTRRVYRFLKEFSLLRPMLVSLRARFAQFQTRTARKHNGNSATATLVLPRLSRSYTIAFTMRSGSNEICNLLGINELGIPGEFFQNPLSSNPAEFVASFQQIVKQNQVGGVFGSKMSHDHRAALDEQLRVVVPNYQGFDSLLPSHRWIWLKRDDKVLQAISWCRAEASNQWAVMRKEKVETKTFSYDFLHILSRLMMIYTGEFAWESYFQKHRIVPFVIVYETFFQDLDRQLPALIQYLGGLPPGRPFMDRELTYKIQRNKESHALRERFISDLGRIGEQSIAQSLGEPLVRWNRFMFEYGWRSERASTAT